MTVLDHAIAYLRSGVSVIPIRRGGTKAPAVGSWAPYQERLPAEDEARSWWASPQPPGIAAVCGGISGGLELIDFDRDAESIYPAWREMVREGWPGLLGRVCAHRTPRPGYHVWLRCGNIETPGNQKLATDPARPGDERTLIETRGEGGYALLPGCPPECHERLLGYDHVGGPTLCELPDLSMDERDFLFACARSFDRAQAKAPPAFMVPAPPASLRPGDDFDRNGPDWADILAPAGWQLAAQDGAERRWRRPGKAQGWSATTGRCEGKGGEDLLHVFSSNAHPFDEGKNYGKFRAYALLHHGGDLTAAARELRAKGYGGPPTQPPAASAERRPEGVVSGFGSVVSGPLAARPLPADPYVPFPTEHLPAPLRDFVLQGAEALGCDPAYLALPVLSVAAGCIGATRTVKLKRSWEEPAVIWAAVVGESGTLKTPAFKLALNPLRRVQHERIEDARRAAAKWRDDQKRAREEGADFDEAKPTPQRIVVADTTIERLAELLEDNPRGLVVARDELAGWLGSFSRYKAKGAGSDLPNWLEMHSAGAITVDRKTGERKLVYVSRACASVAGGIQWGTLARTLTPEFFESGLTARVLLAWPDRRRKAWTEADVPEATQQAYEALIRALLTLELRTEGDERLPDRIDLSRPARRAWVAFYDEWAAEQADAEGELASALSKLEGYAARLALVHHVVTRITTDNLVNADMGAESIAAGVGMVRWFAGEARRIYTHLAETEEQRAARRLAQWVAHKGGVATARELHRASGRRYPRSEDAEAALKALAEAGLGQWVEAPPGPKGGRPTGRFILTPTQPKPDKTPPDWPGEGEEVTECGTDETLHDT